MSKLSDKYAHNDDPADGGYGPLSADLGCGVGVCGVWRQRLGVKRIEREQGPCR